jgi:2-dehydropantoate 2-reductase
MFAVKMWDTESAARAVKPLIGPDTAVISFQNGVEAEDLLATVVGREHVMGGAAYVFSSIAEPGVIRHVGQNHRLVFGELDGRTSPRAEAFCNAARGAGIDASVSDNIVRDVWAKFVFLCPLSGMCTLSRCPTGRVVGTPATRELLEAGMREVAAVATAKGVPLPPDIVERQLGTARGQAPDHKPSMLYDLEHGHRLEVEWLNGAVARLGRDLGVPTPVNGFIAAVLSLHAGSPGLPAPR